MNYQAIIVAGGTGTRMGADMPKQFLSYANKPILIHTVSKFLSCSFEIRLIIVVHKDYFSYAENLCNEYFGKDIVEKFVFVEGGNSRFQSVKNGLEKVKNESGIVAIHDSVRSLLSPELIERCFLHAAKFGSAIPVVKVTDSIRMLRTDGLTKALDRSILRSVQTPQCFDIALVHYAYCVEEQNSFTDSASVVEFVGEKVSIVEGEDQNIKITRPQDLLIADKLDG